MLIDHFVVDDNGNPISLSDTYCHHCDTDPLLFLFDGSAASHDDRCDSLGNHAGNTIYWIPMDGHAWDFESETPFDAASECLERVSVLHAALQLSGAIKEREWYTDMIARATGPLKWLNENGDHDLAGIVAIRIIGHAMTVMMLLSEGVGQFVDRSLIRSKSNPPMDIRSWSTETISYNGKHGTAYRKRAEHTDCRRAIDHAKWVAPAGKWPDQKPPGSTVE
jgi:hypothetical protein